MAELIITDDNYQTLTSHPNRERGLVRRDWSKVEYGSQEFAAPFDIPLLSFEEIIDIATTMEKDRSRLSDIMKSANVPCLDQGQIPFCHAYSPAAAMMGLRALSGQPLVLLSPGYLGSMVTGGRARGAWIIDDLRILAKNGIASQEFVPHNFVGLKFRDGAHADASKYKCEEWYDFPRDSKAWQRMLTCLCYRIPVCTGHNWWGHAVTAFDPVWDAKKRRLMARFRNSWGSGYGEDGWFLMEEGKGRPDEAYAPRVATVSPRGTSSQVGRHVVA